jgi:hypothetical protein
MSKKLEQLFDLSDSSVSDETTKIEEVVVVSEQSLTTIERIERALPQVRGLEASDEEMDQLAEMAKNSYKDLIDLGMQVEQRFSSEIFNAASSMLGHAITAKTAKVQKKLKMLELQLKMAAINQKEAAKSNELAQIPNGTAVGDAKQMLDRNELLKQHSRKTDEQ